MGEVKNLCLEGRCKMELQRGKHSRVEGGEANALFLEGPAF